MKKLLVWARLCCVCRLQMICVFANGVSGCCVWRKRGECCGCFESAWAAGGFCYQASRQCGRRNGFTGFAPLRRGYKCGNQGRKASGNLFSGKGFSSCSSICTYDRAHSAIAEAKPEEFDWKRIFEEAGWFHFSGITPALSDEAAEICLQACQTARELGIGVSCDVNYRSKLWSMDKAREVMSEIGRYVDVAIVNEEEAAVLGADIRVDEAMNAEVYAQMAEQLNKKFDFGKIASVARVPSENGLAVQGMLWDRNGICRSRRYPLESVVDPLGAGDAFAAALLYCFLKAEIAENQETVEFASAACALKHRIKGDYLLVKPADVLALTDNVRGRVCGVQR